MVDKAIGFRAFMIIVAVIVLFALIAIYQSTKSQPKESERFSATLQPKRHESFTTVPVASKPILPPAAAPPSRPPATAAVSVLPSEPINNEQYRAVDFGSGAPAASPPNKRLTAEDLLPKDAANTKWAQVTPSGQGELRDLNFMTAGWHIGVNTQGQSLRNANLQLRSDPVNPQMKVSPWNMSTVEPDVSRRPFEMS